MILCNFIYNISYAGYSFYMEKDIVLPAFPHKQMWVHDGDVELNLEDGPAPQHRTSISCDANTGKVTVCVTESYIKSGTEEIANVVKTFEQEGWKRDFSDESLNELYKMIKAKEIDTDILRQ